MTRCRPGPERVFVQGNVTAMMDHRIDVITVSSDASPSCYSRGYADTSTTDPATGEEVLERQYPQIYPLSRQDVRSEITIAFLANGVMVCPEAVERGANVSGTSTVYLDRARRVWDETDDHAGFTDGCESRPESPFENVLQRWLELLAAQAEAGMYDTADDDLPLDEDTEDTDALESICETYQTQDGSCDSGDSAMRTLCCSVGANEDWASDDTATDDGDTGAESDELNGDLGYSPAPDEVTWLY